LICVNFSVLKGLGSPKAGSLKTKPCLGQHVCGKPNAITSCDHRTVIFFAPNESALGGTNRNNRAGLTMSVHNGRPEVTG
jgi:hypothetical protein